MNIFAKPKLQLFKVKDGITHELAGAMIGNIPSPVDLVERGIAGPQLDIVKQQVLL